MLEIKSWHLTWGGPKNNHYSNSTFIKPPRSIKILKTALNSVLWIPLFKKYFFHCGATSFMSNKIFILWELALIILTKLHNFATFAKNFICLICHLFPWKNVYILQLLFKNTTYIKSQEKIIKLKSWEDHHNCEEKGFYIPLKL